jgi:hypothetical protein
MSHRKQSTAKRGQAFENQKTQSGESPSDPVFERAMRYAQAGNIERALHLLDAGGREAHFRNARGVCLMRLGKFDDAIRVLRELALAPGCTWMRPELPVAYKTNFATALLLGGHAAGCLEILAEINDEQHPSVKRLRAAIRRWQASLSWWQWLNWKISRIEPSGRPATIDFPPGEFGVEGEVTTPITEQPGEPPTPLRTAV